MKRQIDRFRLVEQLGEGGGGAVFRAEETLAPGVMRLVAVKILPAVSPKDKSPESRFIAEVRAMSALCGHPHIVAMYGAGITDSIPWIASEHLPRSLVDVIGEAPADAGEVARMVRHVARALAAMHELQPPLLHNDLKPGNIFLDACDNYKVGDFGSASPEGIERTRVIATVRYAAPELLSRNLGVTGPGTDLYALGHIAYEMALGGKLYRKQFPSVYDEHDQSKDAPPARWMAWHCSGASVAPPLHEVRPGFPAGISEMIGRLMAKDPGQRRSSAKAVLEELKAPAMAMAAPVMEAGLALEDQSGPAPAAGRPAVPARKVVVSPVRPPASASAAPATGAKYWVKLRGQVTGPFDLPTLQRQARAGRISRLHQVSQDRATWQSASTVEGLF